MKILGRPWQWWAGAPLEPARFVMVWNAFRVYRRPLRESVPATRRSAASIRYVCELRTPIGR